MDDVDMVVANLKTLAEKQALAQSKLNEAEAELAKKLKEFEEEQLKRNRIEKDVMISQQNLRTVNEKSAELFDNYKQNETIINDLTAELTTLNRKLYETSSQMNTVKSLQQKYNKNQLKHQEKVKAFENYNTETESDNSEYDAIKSQVDDLLEKKRKLDDGDLLMKLISTGQACRTVESQKEAIESNIDEKRRLVESLSAELVETQSAIKKVQLAIRIDENQHQARLLRMKKQLGQLEAQFPADFDDDGDDVAFAFDI